MAQFGILSTFDYNVQSWNTFKNRINQWFIANDINGNEVKKRASDLALPKDLQFLSFVEIIKLMDDHFAPKKRGFSDRYLFYTATQSVGETYPQWAARLRGLTAGCNFSNVEEALRDRFLMGMLPGPEKEKLFAQDMSELFLIKAIEQADCMSKAAKIASEIKHNDVIDKNTRALTKSSKNQNTYNGCIKRPECHVKLKCETCSERQRLCTKIRYFEFRSNEDCTDGLLNIRSFIRDPTESPLVITILVALLILIICVMFC